MRKAVLMSDESQLNRQLFAKSYRLSCKKDFNFVFDKAERVSDRNFLILFRKQDKSSARLGLAVAKKHAKLAVQRNRIKRVIRESFRAEQSSMPTVDVVVMIRPRATQASKKQLFISLKKLWQEM